MNHSNELVVLNKSLGLYLKPLAKLLITVILPEKKIVGKMISNWEVMETIKKKIIPEVFLSLKVCISSLTKVLLEAEVTCTKDQASIIKKLDGNSIKLSGFQDKFNILSEPAKIKILRKNEWETYFKNTVDCDPQDRPDTVYLDDLPTSWFKSNSKTIEENVIETFSKFGDISATAFPRLDPYEERINNIIETGCDIHVSQGFKKTSFAARGVIFDAYIKYSCHSAFSLCVSALNGMKMVRLVAGETEHHYCNFKLDFDKKKRLSSKTISTRDKIRRDLVEQELRSQHELLALESIQTNIDEESRKKDEQVSEEQKEIESRREYKENERKQKRNQEILKRDNHLIELDKDIDDINKRIQSVRECRKFSANQLLKSAFNHIQQELDISKSSKKRRRSHSHKSSRHSKHVHSSKVRHSDRKRK